MLAFIKKLLPQKFIEYIRIKRHEKFVLQSNFEDHLIKQQTIQQFAQKHHIEVLIETGTYIGRMIKAQLPFFKEIISIEIDPAVFNYNKRKFKRDSRVTLLLGDSGTLLKELCKTLDQSALFWLDGHYSGGLTGKGLLDTPVVDELKAVFANKHDHCILIDDARLFDGTNDYPGYEALKLFVMENKPNAAVTTVNDIIVIEYV